jgi:hypothetical protein
MAYLATLALSCFFFVIGLAYRRSSAKPIDKSFSAELIVKAIGLAGALAGGMVPMLWLTYMYAMSGSPIATSLPPGYDENVLRAVLLIGAPVMLNYAYFGWLDHVRK